MGYRAVVENHKIIRALASSTNISIVDAQFEKTRAVILAPYYDASVTSRVMSAIANYSNAVSQIHYRNIFATSVVLDPFSLNKYFRLDQAVIADIPSVTTSKGLSNITGLSDEQVFFLIGKGNSDSFGMGDQAVVLMEFIRSFTEYPSVADSSALSLGVAKSETIEISDIAEMLASKSVADTANLSEQSIYSFSKPLSESTIISDQISKTTVFERSFSDAFVLDDFTDVAAITKSTTAAKSNVIGFSETHSFATDKAFSDAFNFAEQSVAAFEKSLFDSAILTESIQISVSSLASSVLNASTLNSAPLNN